MVEYLEDNFTDIKYISKPLKNPYFTASGYGNKLPTEYAVIFNNRLHRVYAICYSNVASFYVISQKKKYFVNEHKLEEVRDSLK